MKKKNINKTNEDLSAKEINKATSKNPETIKKASAEKSISKNVDEEKHSVPTMGERKSPSRGGVLNRHKKKHKPNTPGIKKDDRPVINISNSTQEKFVDFACTKNIFDLVEAKKKVQQKEVSEEIFEKFVDSLWVSKCQPQNPNIKAKSDKGLDATGQFIVSAGSKIKINMPEVKDEEEPEHALIRGLINAGVSAHNAENLVENEIDFAPNFSLNFTDLMRGEIKEGKINNSSSAQSSAAEILFCAIHGEDLDGNPIDAKSRIKLLEEISSDGWEALKKNIEDRTTYAPVLVDSKDFLDRICNYADSRDELSGLLTVFCPVYYCQRVCFAPSKDEKTRKSKMTDCAKQIILEGGSE